MGGILVSLVHETEEEKEEKSQKLHLASYPGCCGSL